MAASERILSESRSAIAATRASARTTANAIVAITDATMMINAATLPAPCDQLPRGRPHAQADTWVPMRNDLATP